MIRLPNEVNHDMGPTNSKPPQASEHDGKPTGHDEVRRRRRGPASGAHNAKACGAAKAYAIEASSGRRDFSTQSTQDAARERRDGTQVAARVANGSEGADRRRGQTGIQGYGGRPRHQLRLVRAR